MSTAVTEHEKWPTKCIFMLIASALALRNAKAPPRFVCNVSTSCRFWSWHVKELRASRESEFTEGDHASMSPHARAKR